MPDRRGTRGCRGRTCAPSSAMHRQLRLRARGRKDPEADARVRRQRLSRLGAPAGASARSRGSCARRSTPSSRPGTGSRSPAAPTPACTPRGQVASVRAAGGPPAERAAEGAQRGSAGRRRRARGRGGARRLQRALLGPFARVPLPDPAAPRALALRGAPGAVVAEAARPRRPATPPRRCCPGRTTSRPSRRPRREHTRFERTVLAAAWEEHGDELHFTIEAVSFLRHMVRILVGSMLEGLRARAAARGPAPQRGRQDRAAVGPVPGARRVLNASVRSNHALPGRPLRLRRHRDRLRLDHHRLDAARDEDRARPRHPGRGARARGRRLRA